MDDRTRARFFSFVKEGPVARNRPDLGRCWIWTGGKNKGYGVFWAYGKTHRAHKFSYRAFVREVPDGLELDHFACDRTDCVNYLHVRPATSRENVLRSGNPMAANAAKEECPDGHLFAEHGRINSDGSRECVLCKRKQQREGKKARRDAARGHEVPRATETHCANGHLWTPETKYFRPGRSAPDCKTCRRESQAASRAAAKGARAA